MPVLETRSLTKVYKDASGDNVVFKDINLSVKNGESVLIIGNSGCGKSTFLQISGLLQKPTEGQVIIDGDVFDKRSSEKKINNVLQKKVGFIQQFHYLFNDFTAKENLVIPQIIAGIDRKKAELEADKMLKKLSLFHRKDAMPNELSGGERQRVAVARAIIKKPLLILADEPTGNLDNDMSNFVVDEMLKMVKELKISLVMVSHCLDFKKKFDRIVKLTNRQLIED